MATEARPTAAFRGKWEAIRDTGILGKLTPRGLKSMKLLLQEGSRPHLLYNLHAYNFPDKPAFVFGDRSISFGELLARVNRLANALYRLGVRPGDRVAMMLKNSPEYLEVQTACSKIGAAAVFVNYRLTPPEVEYIVNNSGSTALVYDHDFAGTVEAARDRFEGVAKDRYVVVRGAGAPGDKRYEDLLAANSPEDPPSPGRAGTNQVVIYTSGTTGRPKGAVRNMAKAGVGEILNFLQVVPVRHSDVHLVCAPMYHATATGLGTTNFVFGATLAIMERFRPEEFLAAVARHGVT
ncbi:MAG: AMP-binding protein, partial [Candidatus Methylomirabilis sp.]|nr:AMP-binding protein [Deltaproteobacteria bacterium]